MPVSFPVATDIALQTLQQSLFGSFGEMTWNDPVIVGRSELRGVVKGGNLSVLYSLSGSPELPDNHGAIVFLEDVDEHLYHVDRMITGLWRAGFFEGAKGIVAGGMTQMKDNTREFGFPADNPWGADCFQTIRLLGERLGIPVITGFPAGHMNDNRAFYLGLEAGITVENGICTLRYHT
jgi:muramoyltetrapeptide carboxypeptidase